jgi:hypothetical protein
VLRDKLIDRTEGIGRGAIEMAIDSISVCHIGR